MRVKDWMSPSPVTVPADHGVFAARRLMEERRIRHLPITRDGELVGIVTDRDIRLNLPSPATSLSVWEVNYILGRLTVGEVMTRTLVVIGPERDIAAAARLMVDHRIGALPVVDGGRLVGLITETDLLRALLHREQSPGVPHVAAARR
jgi:acetoin utilization protein AcuB